MNKTEKLLAAGVVLGTAYWWFVVRPKDPRFAKQAPVPLTSGLPFGVGHTGEDEPCCEACARGEACSGVGACSRAWHDDEERVVAGEEQTGGA